MNLRLTILLLEQRKKHRREVVPEAAQGLGELGTLNGPRPISVEVPKDVLPVLNILPQTREFWKYVLTHHTRNKLNVARLAIEPNRPTAVRILERHLEGN